MNTRRLRVDPRPIKRKMSQWSLKRTHHRNPALHAQHPEMPDHECKQAWTLTKWYWA